MRTRLYLETSIWGFYHDESLRNQLRREAVRTLCEQVRMGMFEAYWGRLVYDELDASAEPFRSRELGLMESLASPLPEPAADELARLLEAYQEAGVLAERHRSDLLHAAYAALSDVHVLVTYNCRHLANYRVVQRIKAVNLANGYRTDFEIRTPEEVIAYDETDDGR
jgi:hypothetical protein